MLFSPSKTDRAVILEAIPLSDENLRKIHGKFFQGQEKMKLSPALHSYCSGKRVILYNARTLGKVVGTEELKSFYKRLKSLNSFDYNQARGLASSMGVPADYVIEECLKKQFFIAPQADNKPAPGCKAMHTHCSRGLMPGSQRLFISLTGIEEPHCSYTLLPSLPGKAVSLIDASVLERSLQLFGQVFSPEHSVIILSAGGKKISTRKLVKKLTPLMEYCKEYPMQKVIFMIDGSSIDSSLAEFLSHLNPEVHVTVDWPSGGRGKSRWTESLAPLRLLREHLPLVVPVFSLHPGHKALFYQCLDIIAHEKLAQYIGLHPAPLSPEKQEKGGDMAALYMDSFRELRLRGLKEINTGKALWAFVNERPRVASCYLGGGQIFVNSAGEAGRCSYLQERGTGKIGHTEDSGLLDKIKQASKDFALRKILPLQADDCQECLALGICGGWCAADSLLRIGDPYLRNPVYCDFIKGITRGLLDEICHAQETGRKCL